MVYTLSTESWVQTCGEFSCSAHDSVGFSPAALVSPTSENRTRLTVLMWAQDALAKEVVDH